MSRIRITLAVLFSILSVNLYSQHSYAKFVRNQRVDVFTAIDRSYSISPEKIDGHTGLGQNATGEPVVSVTLHKAGESAATSFAQGTDIIVDVSATDANYSITQVELFDGSGKIGEDLTFPYSFSWHASTVGAVRLFVGVTNSNYEGKLVTVDFTITGTPPSITLAGSGERISEGTDYVLTANATDVNGNTITKVEFFDGITKIATVTSAPFVYRHLHPSLGNHNYVAAATSSSGLSTLSNAKGVDVVSASLYPTVYISAPTANAQYTIGSDITITAVATPAAGPISKVEFYEDYNKLGEATSAPYSISWLPTATGDYSLVAKVTDNAGLSVESGYVDITVNAAPVSVSGWSLTGNGGLSAATQFLGTTDAQPLIFKTSNTERSRFSANGNLLLGTTTDNESHKLQVNGYILSKGLTITDGAGANKVLTSDANGNASWQTQTGGSSSGSSNWSVNGNNIFNLNSGYVGIGQPSVSVPNDVNIKLAVNGFIYAKKLVVQSDWADYVFAPGYKLRPLWQVEKFILANKHLPELPSAAEVEKSGIDLGNNQVILLKKIEELTLYIIQDHKEIEKLKTMNRILSKNRISSKKTNKK